MHSVPLYHIKIREPFVFVTIKGSSLADNCVIRDDKRNISNTHNTGVVAIIRGVFLTAVGVCKLLHSTIDR